jgi:hypothetical protein
VNKILVPSSRSSSSYLLLLLLNQNSSLLYRDKPTTLDTPPSTSRQFTTIIIIIVIISLLLHHPPQFLSSPSFVPLLIPPHPATATARRAVFSSPATRRDHHRISGNWKGLPNRLAERLSGKHHLDSQPWQQNGDLQISITQDKGRALSISKAEDSHFHFYRHHYICDMRCVYPATFPLRPAALLQDLGAAMP